MKYSRRQACLCVICRQINTEVNETLHSPLSTKGILQNFLSSIKLGRGNLQEKTFLLTLMLLSIFLLFPRHSFAEDAIKLTLDEAVHQAIENNLGLKVERYSPAIASQDVTIEKGLFDPSITSNLSELYESAPSPSIITSVQQRSFDLDISLSGKIETGTEYTLKWDYQKFRGDSTFLRLNPYHLTGLTLTVSQPLFKGFGKDMQTSMLRVAKGNLRVSEYILKNKTEELISNTVTAYYNVLLAEDTVGNARFSLSLAKKLLKEVEAKIEVGVLAPVEIYKAEAEVAKREEVLLEAENLLRDSLDSLRLVLGIQDWDREIMLSRPHTIFNEPPDLTESINNSLSYRNDLRQVFTEKDNKRVLTAFYKNQTLPDLEIFGTFELSGLSSSLSEALDRLSEGTDRNWQLGFSLQIPLFQRTAKGRYLKAKYEQERTEATIRELQQKIVLEVRQAWRALSLSLKRIEASKKTRIASEKRLEAEEGRFHEGLTTLNDLLQFQKEYAESLLEEKKAIFDYHLSIADFEKTKGTLMQKFGISLKGA